LVFDVRTDTNDNGGGKVREYRCPARHRIVPYTSIRKSLSSAVQSCRSTCMEPSCLLASSAVGQRGGSVGRRDCLGDSEARQDRPQLELTCRIHLGSLRIKSISMLPVACWS
jgi:hypothetical protein